MKPRLFPRLIRVFSSGALLVSGFTALAATVTWDGGGGDNSWHTAKNWSSDIGPGPSDDVVIPKGNIFVEVSRSVEISGLSLGARASLTVQGAGVRFVANGNGKIDGASLYVKSGAIVLLPGLVSYFGDTADHTYLSATGGGSVLDLPALTELIGSLSLSGYVTYVQASSGGTIKMSAVSAMTQGAIELNASGKGSAIEAPQLARLKGRVDLLASVGAVLRLPALVSYAGDVNDPSHHSYLRATNEGSVLDLPALTELIGSLSLNGYVTYVQAQSGGTIRLSPSLTKITEGRTAISSVGLGSLVDLSSLTQFAVPGTPSTMEASNGGSIQVPAAIQLDGVTLKGVTPGTVAPRVTSQPSDLRIALNGMGNFEVVAIGTLPLNVQWQFEFQAGVWRDLEGQASTILSLRNVGFANEGNYRVVVSNIAGKVVSRVAKLEVGSLPPSTAPLITAQPTSQTVTVGASVTFSVVASGTEPLRFQWQKNGIPITGATVVTLSLSNVQATVAGTYTVVVSNVAGSVTSQPAVLTVQGPQPTSPTIVTQPKSQAVSVGSSVSLSVVASGTEPLRFQWQKNGVPITGATAATLSLSSVQATDAGSYTVVVSNAAGSITSNAAVLTVPTPPSTPPHPADVNKDFRIVISEVTGYSAAWRKADPWPEPPSPVPISYMTRAAALWKGGEKYKHDPTIGTAPLWWVNDTGTIRPQSIDFVRSLAAGSSRIASTVSGFVVTLTVTPAAGINAYAVEENVPTGFTAKNISESGQFDARSMRLTWGPFFDAQTRTLSYELVPPAGFAGKAILNGLGSFDGVDIVIGGDRTAGAGGGEKKGMAVRTIIQAAGKVQVSVLVTPSSTITAYALEEGVPKNWSASGINESGIFDTVSGKIKWGPFFENQARTFSYVLQAPAGVATGDMPGGIASFDAGDVPVTGDNRIIIETSGGQHLELEIELLAGVWVRGMVGQRYRIEYSEDLGANVWQLAITLTLEVSPQLWVDPDSTRRPRRFYRALRIP